MLGEKTVKALLGLKPSGERSFEDLLRELLSELSGQVFYLCSAGSQWGIDGPTANRSIGFEAKLYGDSHLKIPYLLGEIDQASRTWPDLELWVLVTTQRLSAQHQKELGDSAAERGIAFLAIAEADSQQSFHPLAGLCAVLPERVCEVLADSAWLDKRKKRSPEISTDLIRTELSQIASSPHFTSFRDSLGQKLRELPTWRIFVQSHNQRVKRAIIEDSRVRFGTDFHRNEVIPRTVSSEIAQWFEEATSSQEPQLATVLGERFDGKTWVVFDWLVGQLDSLEIPVFILGPNQGDALSELNDFLRREVEGALGPYGRHANAILNRHRHRSAGRVPWCLLILDGLNEYRNSPLPWQRHLSDAHARIEPDYRPAAVLCTVRAKSWCEVEEGVRGSVGGKVSAIKVGPFDDREFAEALARVEKTFEEISILPMSARELIRRPRFFMLVLKHRDRLGNFELVNEDVLYWLDVSDKVGRERASGFTTEEQFQGALMELATKSAERHSLTIKEVVDSLRRICDEVEAAFKDLLSEGILEKKGRQFTVCAEHLCTGRALCLLERLEVSTGDQQALREQLRDELAPFGDDDIAADWLRRASVIALLSEEPTADDVVDVLVDEWLRSRNRPVDDLEQVRTLSPFSPAAPSPLSAEDLDAKHRSPGPPGTVDRHFRGKLAPRDGPSPAIRQQVVPARSTSRNLVYRG